MSITIPTRVWPGDEPTPLPHPAPEVCARIAEALEIPRNAARLAALAVANGWIVRVMFARGSWPGRLKGGIPTRYTVVDSIALYFRRDTARAVGIWHDWRFHSGLVADTPRLLNEGELRARIEATP